MRRILVLIGLALLGGALALALSSRSGGKQSVLTVFCAAGLKKPVDAAAASYSAEGLGEIRFQYGGTATLLSQLKVTQAGDLFIAADQGALEDARRLGLLREVIPLVEQRPVLAVRAGNPKNLRSLQDLYREGVRVAVANPEAASIGKRTKKALGAEWERFAARVAVMKPTVTEIAADLSLGAVDAAVIWDATVKQFNGLEAVDLPEFAGSKDVPSVAVLASAKNPAEALRFARYLAAPERGGAVFTQQGFTALRGDTWEREPGLVLYSGGVNRPAIEKLLERFAAREGVKITTVFNGCGVLCASMKAMKDAPQAQFPDVYYACDLCFVPPVAAEFPEVTLLTEARIGIAVPKGSPRGVKELKDLAQPGLRVGLCNAEQSTLGALTTEMLRKEGLLEAVKKNAVSEVPTADFLVNQMRAGGLDAALVYSVNVLPQKEHLDYIPLPQKSALAVQPFAVGVNSPRRQMGVRLLEFLKANRSEFEKAGFTWRGEEQPLKSADIEVPEWLKGK